MSRNFRLFAWFMVGFLIAAVPMLSFAATIMPVTVPGVSAVGNELVYTSRAGVASMVYPTLATSAPLSIPVATMVPPGRQLMVIPASVAVAVPRVASAVVALARLSGPVGLGLTLLPILCQETSICQSSTDPNNFSKLTSQSQPQPAIYRVINSTNYSTALAACQNTVDLWCAFPVSGCGQVSVTSETATTIACRGYNSPQVEWKTTTGLKILQSCPAGYTLTNGVCVSDTPMASPPTEGDWSAAISALTSAVSAMGNIVAGLQSVGQPVPINKPVLSPTSSTSSPTSTVNRDPQGNVINTTSTTTTTNIAPVTNTSTTNTVSVTQITNTTVTNNLGQVTSTTDTASDPPAEDDPTIEFDTVPETDLEKQELPLTLTPVSWGEGSCPPDPSVSVMGHQIAVPVHVVCQYMSGVRTAVIAVFALIAAYIVVGVKFEG